MCHNHVGRFICHLNIIASEIIEQSTNTNPLYRGGLLPLHHGGDVGNVREVGEAARGDSGSVFPSNLH
jgi:hypothetical protein